MKDELEQHLKSRKFNKNLYSAVWCEKECITLGLWNLSGNLVGFQQYRYNQLKDRQKNPRDMRYFTYTGSEGCSKKLSAFGVELLNRKDSTLFIAEGIFDVVTLHNKGRNALAVLSNDPKHLRNWLNSLNYHIVALCEGDSAGKRLGKYADTVVFLPDGKDPADMPDEWFDDLIYKYCKEVL